MAAPSFSSAATSERFEVRETLGSGAMGTVYRAHDRLRRADVALKILHRASAARLYRFKREFRALSGLVHRNLVTLYELNTEGDTCFFTMEVVQGTDFLDWVRPYKHHLPGLPSVLPATNATATCDPDQIDNRVWDADGASPKRRAIARASLRGKRLVPALRELVAGVCALHDAGMLHRDLKPSNVLVEPNGRVLLCDFGLVQDLGRSDDQERVIWGTPGYMSPEQAAGLALSEASDWYTVGVMLFEALTGRLPFGGTSREVMQAKVSQPAPLVLKYALDADRELAALCDRLLEFDVHHRPPTDELRRFAGLPVAPARSRRQATQDAPEGAPLLGRERELATLRAAAERARSGTISSVLVGGPSGIGKSALCEHFADTIRRRAGDASDAGFLVLSGSCYERETVPYKTLDALVDALGGALLELDEEERERVIPGDVSALVRLFPALARVTGSLESSDPGDVTDVRRRAFAALQHILRALAQRRPVMLFIDDLQWGDADSAPFLTHLLRGNEQARILLVATYRSEDVGASPSLDALLNTKAPTCIASACDFVDLRGLSPDAAAALARSVADPAAETVDVAELVDQANGHPLFLTELARALVTGDQWTRENGLDGLLRARIDQLDGSARKLLEFVAVAGRPIPLALLREAARTKDEPAAVAALCASHLTRTAWRDGAEELDTFHDRVRENAVAAIAPERLRRLHRRIGSALEWSRRADPGEVLEHWIAAGDRDRAAQYAEIAAARAEGALAFSQAVLAYERVLELSNPRGRARSAVLQKLAEMLTNAGRPAEAADRFLEAASLVSEGEAAVLRGRAAEELIRFGRVERGIDMAKGALRSVGIPFPENRARIVFGIAWRRLWIRARGERFVERPPDQRDTKALQRLDACQSVAGGLGFVLPVHGAYFQTRSLVWALEAGDPERMVVTLCHDVGFRSVRGAGARPGVEALVQRARALSKRLKSPGLLGFCAGVNGISKFLSGQFAGALADLEECERLLLTDDDQRFLWQRSLMTVYRLATLVYLGRIAQLRQEVNARIDLAIEDSDEYVANALRARRANVVWLASDEVAEARRQVEAGEPDPAAATFTIQHVLSMVSHCQISLYAGEADDARHRLDQAWGRMRKSMNMRVQSVRIEAHFLRARIALCQVADRLATRRGRSKATTAPQFVAPGGKSAGHPASAGVRLSGDVRALLETAEQSARQLAREGAPWACAYAGLIQAGISSARGQRRAALAQLSRAVQACEDASLLLHARSARYQLERLQRGDAAHLSDAMRDWARGQGVADARRFLSMFAPVPM